MTTNAEPADGDFYATVPVFAGFPSIMDPAQYAPLPDDWLIAITDVRNSTQAIEAGRYKAVNTAGAAIIAALTNALERGPFPFVFGGDGASLAVSSRDEAAARAALAATAAWSRDELGLALRAALIPVAALREQGLDVRVARYAPSPNVSYAMFSGGGLSEADRLLKAGRFAVEPAGAGVRPDLSGLSCRWNDIPATRGVIVSLVVAPVRAGRPCVPRARRSAAAGARNQRGGCAPVPDGAPGSAGRRLASTSRHALRAGAERGSRSRGCAWRCRR